MHPSNVTVVESSESEASDIEATSPNRKDVSGKFIKKEEVQRQFSCYINVTVCGLMVS